MSRYLTKRQRQREEMLASGQPTCVEIQRLGDEREADFAAKNRSIAAWMRANPTAVHTISARFVIRAGRDLPDDLLVTLNELALQDFF